MTFDKLFYDFSGKCGYLLAKDFVHENDFSAIVDYERDMEIPIRNMMFMIDSVTFEIKSDGTVRILPCVSFWSFKTSHPTDASVTYSIHQKYRDMFWKGF